MDLWGKGFPDVQGLHPSLIVESLARLFTADDPPLDLVFHGDIGCYSMLKYTPFSSLMHNLSGMGLGGGTGAGIDPFIDNKQLVFMGDSTFFHTGMIAISDSIKNGQDITYIILDNKTTTMTGHQPTPGIDTDVLGQPTFAQNIEKIARGLAGDGELFIARMNPAERADYTELHREERDFLAWYEDLLGRFTYRNADEYQTWVRVLSLPGKSAATATSEFPRWRRPKAARES